jgi:hypothetical protein
MKAGMPQQAEDRRAAAEDCGAAAAAERSGFFFLFPEIYVILTVVDRHDHDNN